MGGRPGPLCRVSEVPRCRPGRLLHRLPRIAPQVHRCQRKCSGDSRGTCQWDEEWFVELELAGNVCIYELCYLSVFRTYQLTKFRYKDIFTNILGKFSGVPLFSFSNRKPRDCHNRHHRRVFRLASRIIALKLAH